MGNTAASELLPTWGQDYPDPGALRADVEAMVAAVVAALLGHLPDGIAGLWFKGSAQKEWDSPIDYVPEVGDIDIHVRVASPAATARLTDPHDVIAIHARIESEFRRTRPDPLHVPRVQFVPADEVERIPGYVPAPASTVRTLHGAPHTGPGTIDQAAVRRTDATRLAHLSDPAALANETIDLIELPGHHLFWALRRINWRVSPIAPLVLSVSGVDYGTAWSSNRTRLTQLLVDAGFDELARSYTAYYLSAWAFWLSQWRDGDAGRDAFASAIETINAGAQIGAKHQ